jgi:hypothetical protein
MNVSARDPWHGFIMPKAKQPAKSKAKPKSKPKPKQTSDFSRVALSVVEQATGGKLKRR